MAVVFDPVGNVAGVMCIPGEDPDNAVSQVAGIGIMDRHYPCYVPTITFYEPGKPSKIMWSGKPERTASLAMEIANRELARMVPPSMDDLVTSLRNVLRVIDRARYLMAITDHPDVAEARTLLARFDGDAKQAEVSSDRPQSYEVGIYNEERVYVIGRCRYAKEGEIGRDLEIRPIRLGWGEHTMVVCPRRVKKFDLIQPCGGQHRDWMAEG